MKDTKHTQNEYDELKEQLYELSKSSHTANLLADQNYKKLESENTRLREALKDTKDILISVGVTDGKTINRIEEALNSNK